MGIVDFDDVNGFVMCGVVGCFVGVDGCVVLCDCGCIDVLKLVECGVVECDLDGCCVCGGG